MLCVTCGVPQVSILGPLLFTVYINDIIISKLLQIILFLDDTNTFLSGPDKNELCGCLDVELSKSNKLSLNKTL